MRLRGFALLLLGLALFGQQGGLAQAIEPFTGIQISAPVDGTKFNAPADILVTVVGYDNPSTGHVLRLYEDSMLVDAIALDPLIPITVVPVHFHFSFNLDKVKAGKYVLTAMIDDVASQSVNVTVKSKRRPRH